MLEETKFSPSLATVLLVLASPIGCVSPPRSIESLWKNDIDGDSRISRAEFRGTSAMFAKLDANGDGFITLPEAAAFLGAGRKTPPSEYQRAFDLWDRNGDQRLVAEEIPYSPNLVRSVIARFGGTVSKVNRDTALATLDSALMAELNRPGGWVRALDLNDDGEVSTSEFPPSLDPVVLQGFDLDKNGRITINEVAEEMLPPQRWRPLTAAARFVHDFAAFDRDSNGVLDARELGRSSYLIGHLDLDGDRRLRRSELDSAARLMRYGPSAYHRYVSRIKFRRLDANRDGLLEPAEYQQLGRFAQIVDQDHNGVISFDEFDQREVAMRRLLRPVALPPRSSHEPGRIDHQ